MSLFMLFFREIKYFTNFNNKMYQFLLFFQPLVFLLIYYFLIQLRGGGEAGGFVVTAAVISMWSYVLYSSGSALVSQRWNDTLNLLVAAPISLFTVVLTKALSNSFISIISMAISFSYAKFLFRFELGIGHYPLFLLAIAALVFSLSVVGIILAIVFAASEKSIEFQNLILTPFILLCGVFIPVDQFPEILKWIAYLVPMTWGIQSVQDALANSPGIFGTLAITAGISTVYLGLAFVIIKRMEMVLRQSGRLGAM